jgi:hypothetical protein
MHARKPTSHLIFFALKSHAKEKYNTADDDADVKVK